MKTLGPNDLRHKNLIVRLKLVGPDVFAEVSTTPWCKTKFFQGFFIWKKLATLKLDTTCPDHANGRTVACEVASLKEIKIW